ncbi:tRNA (cytidine(34)-2'-O)-methyltransferase [Limisalsivibrio acetivorans]|uniref:tRNA (cytidine(34)-2'-O)-methyltransferase n=1 Tax=Limisalsivibrio acetivorans TaxID=1304888 RepID=UPI0003B71C1F|nr:tRNA (cytidine(34)-2'-O)-methyltransferase [Limisalsivibrio acetivorans]
MIHIALIEPEIPQNTGNIGRLCVATGSELILCGKLGFSLDDKYLKRAGLDYWKKVKLTRVEEVEDLFSLYPADEYTYAVLSKKAETEYTEIPVESGKELLLIFGRETEGLDEEMLNRYGDYLYRIPTTGDVRSLNLSNAVAVITYDILRRIDFCGLEKKCLESAR